MAKRTYNVKGTQDFLVLAVIFLFLCLWAVKDAWFPSPKVLEKHPPLVELSFETAGSIERIHVSVGDSVGKTQVVAELRQVKQEADLTAAKKEYTAAKDQVRLLETAVKNAVRNGASDPGIAEFRQNLAGAQGTMDSAFEKITELRAQLVAGELVSEGKGEVKSISKGVHSQVAAGETVMVLDPKGHFYTFNKSLAIFSFIAFWVFICLHLLGN